MNPNSKPFTMSAAASVFVPGRGMVQVQTQAKAATEPAKDASVPTASPAADTSAAPAAVKETEVEAKKPEEKAPAPKVEKIALDDVEEDAKFAVSEKELEQEVAAIAAAEGKRVEDLMAAAAEDDDDNEEDELEADDEREPVNVVFIGHVDAGKSTLSGQILYSCGMVDERTIEKYQQTAKENNRESWFLSYIMDTNEEERAKGKTVEVGRAFFNTTKRRYTILDAPGHKNYVPNMIGGAAQADIGVLVISARQGEFEAGFNRGGQTREHAMLCKTLGVRTLVVVINKMDEPTVEWSKVRYDEIEGQLGTFLRSVGYAKNDVEFVPVSGLKGTNVMKGVQEDPSNTELQKLYAWYKGKPLIATLDGLKSIVRLADAPVRLPILDKTKDRGMTMLLGKLETGTVSVGDQLVLVPSNASVEIVSLHTDQAKIRRARPGENIRIGIKGVEEDGVQRGFMLSSPGSLMVPCVTKFEAQLAILELLPHKTIFSAGYKAIIHVHTAVEECLVTHLLASINKKTGAVDQKRPKFVKAGAVVTCIVRVARAVPIELFKNSPQLGRFTLRDEGKTIAIGKITRLPGQGKTEA